VKGAKSHGRYATQRAALYREAWAKKGGGGHTLTLDKDGEARVRNGDGERSQTCLKKKGAEASKCERT